MENSLEIIILLYLTMIGFSVLIRVKSRKKHSYKYFNVIKLVKYQKLRRNWLYFLLITFFFIVYTSYFQTIIFLVILAWFGLISALLVIAHFQDRISLINKSKEKLKIQLEVISSQNLSEIAKVLEYPYSDLKIAINYLKKKGEISQDFS